MLRNEASLFCCEFQVFRKDLIFILLCEKIENEKIQEITRGG